MNMIAADSPSDADPFVSSLGETGFRIPSRAILTKDDLERFETSETHDALVQFIEKLSVAVRGKTLRVEVDNSEACLV